MQTNMAAESQMADTGNQHLNTSTVVVAPSGIAVEEGVNEDILQGAFVDSEEFDQHVEYAVQAETEELSQSVAQQINAVSDSGLDGTSLESTTQIVAQSNGFETETYRVVNALPDGTITLPDELIDQSVEAEGTEQIDETESGVTLVDQNGQHVNVIENQQVLEGQPVIDGQTQILDGQHHILENQHQVLEGQPHVLENQQVLAQHHQGLQTIVSVNQPQQRSQEQKILVHHPAHPGQQGLRLTLIDNAHQPQPQQHSDAPLGSSTNPIRIVQQGNNYTPIQSLTNDQLQQIMQVVHQQQVARNTQEAGNSVLINPTNNSRIVYRVIYPQELHKGLQGPQHAQQTVFHVTQKGGTTTTTTLALPRAGDAATAAVVQLAAGGKRPYRKQRGPGIKEEDDENKMDGPEMSREEKEERKKHRPRTRSGRVSKPPKYMVKDYKHIHVLDWDDDYDDSDGGYSDYKGSDEEGGRGSRDKEATPDLYSAGLAMNSARPKNHKCQTCEKSYIGQAGLLRHYRLNPSHGSMPPEDADSPGYGMLSNSTAEDTNSPPVLMNNGSTPTTTTTISTSTTTPSSINTAATTTTTTTTTPTLPSTIPTISSENGNGTTPMIRVMGGGVLSGRVGGASSSNAGSHTGNLSEDSNTQDSIPSSSGAISPITTTRTPRRGRGGYRGRGRWMHHHYTAPARKKQKLKELVKSVDNEALMEVVLPQLVQCVSLWEFMLMKVETCNASRPRAHHIYQEFQALHKQVKQVCQEGLTPLGKADGSAAGSGSGGQQNGNGIGMIDTDDSQDKAAPILKIEDEAMAKSLGLTAGSYEVKDLPVNDNADFRYKYLTSDPKGPPGIISAQKRTIQVVSPNELVSTSSVSSAKRAKTTSLLPVVSGGTVGTLAHSATAASSLLTSIVSNSGLSGQRGAGGLFHTVAVQQPQGSLLQTVRVQQPPPTITLSAQQPSTPTPILRTVSVPSHTPTVLRTVAVPAASHHHQTSLLRLQPQPTVVLGPPPSSAGSVVRHSMVSSSSSPSFVAGSGGVMGVSLLGNPSSSSSRLAPVLSQSPSPLSMLKSPVVAGTHGSHILVAAAAAPPPSSVSVTAGAGDLPPQSQAAQVVSVLPSSSSSSTAHMHTSSLTLLPHTPGMGSGGDFQPLGPEDFMDNSDDSLVSSVSGLSSANSSGLVSTHASLPNGDAPPPTSDVGFSSVVKVNGVSSSSVSSMSSTAKLEGSLAHHQDGEAVISLGGEAHHGPYISSVVDSLKEEAEEDHQHLPMVTGHGLESSNTTSLLIKCENGELFTYSSNGETIPLPSVSVVDSAEDMVTPSVESSAVNGLLAPSSSSSSPEEALPQASTSGVNGLLNGSPQLEEASAASIKVEEHQDMLLTADDGTSVMAQADPDHDLTPAEGEGDLELGEGVEATSFTFHANSQLYQTDDGTVIIQNPDGTSFQLRGMEEGGLTVETVQELLSQMAASGTASTAEQVTTEMMQQ